MGFAGRLNALSEKNSFAGAIWRLNGPAPAKVADKAKPDATNTGPCTTYEDQENVSSIHPLVLGDYTSELLRGKRLH